MDNPARLIETMPYGVGRDTKRMPRSAAKTHRIEDLPCLKKLPPNGRNKAKREP